MRTITDKFIDFLGVNKSFFSFWVGCIILIIAIQFNLKESTSFVGVVSSRGHEISTSAAASIIKIHVYPGQEVQKGELLLELSQKELDLKISEVNSKIHSLLNEQSVIADIKGGANNSGIKENPEITSLKEQLDILEKSKKELFIFSDFAGKIGQINFKEGEVVAPYTPIMTIQGLVPTTVTGYIHESEIDQIKANQKVMITSLTGESHQGIGSVVSIGSSMVPFPPRLLKDPDRPIWGKEILISLEAKNPFILGEKVFIDHRVKFSMIKNSQAALDKDQRRLAKNVEGTLTLRVSLEDSFEASGIVYLKDLKRYLIISDTKKREKNNKALLIDQQGQVSKKLEIDFLEELADIESISNINSKEILFLTSLKKNKNRQYILKASRNELNFEKIKKVNLYKLLEAAVKNSKDSQLQKLLLDKNELEIDVEGHFIKDQDLYLGLREPMDKSHAIILKIENYETIFNDGSLKSSAVSIWRNFKLQLDSERLSISDLHYDQGILYIAAAPAAKEGRFGAIYRVSVNKKEASPAKVMSFINSKPEGVFYNTSTNQLAVSFDHGDDTSKVEIYDL